jgi:hypothetical protein
MVFLFAFSEADAHGAELSFVLRERASFLWISFPARASPTTESNLENPQMHFAKGQRAFAFLPAKKDIPRGY